MNRCRLPAAVLLTLLVLTGCGQRDSATALASAEQRLARGDAAGAAIDARNALAGNERSPAARFVLASALLAAGDLSGAEIELRRAEQFGHPQDETTLLGARLLLAQGRGEELRMRFAGHRLRSAAATAALATEVARAATAVHDRAGAEQALQTALGAVPGHADALLLRAELLATAGKPDEALLVVSQVTEREPANAAAWLVRGHLLAAQGAVEDAAQAYGRALELRPALEAAHAGLVTLALRAGPQADAALRERVAAMARALPQSPTTAYFQAALAYRDGDWARARDLTQALLKGAGDELRVVYLAGLAEVRLGQQGRAEALLARAMQLAPGALEPRRELAALHASQGQAAKALEVLAPLLALPVQDARAWRVAGQAHLRLGDFRSADAAFARAARIAPDDRGLRLDQARSQLAQGHVDAGLRELQAASTGSDDLDADLALVAVHMSRRDAPAALAVAERMARKQPASPLPDLVRGRVLQSGGDLAAARRAYEAAVAKAPTDLPAVSSLAELDLAEQQVASARRRYEAVLKLSPQSAHAMLALAVITRREGGSRQDAAAWIDRATRADPRDAAVWRLAIEHHRSDDDAAAALARAQAAVAALPDDPILLAELAATQLQARQTLQAISSLSRLTTLQPGSPDSWLRLAQAQVESGDAAAAKSSVARAVQAAPDWPPVIRAQVALALTLDNNPDGAIALARQVQARAPSVALGWQLEAEIEQHRGRWDAAAAAYRAVLDKQPSPEAAAALHQVLSRAGHAQAARRLAAEWLARRPVEPVFLAYLAGMEDAAGDLEAAEAHYRELLVQLPADVRVLNNLADLLVRRRSGEALAMAQRAHALAPYRPEVLDTLAAAHAASGQMRAAAEWQAKAVASAPHNSAMRLALARYLLAGNRKEQALKELRLLDRPETPAAQRAAAVELLGQAGR